MRRPQLARGGHQIVRDVWGEEWRLFERRKTPYGFDLLFGRPYPPPPVQGGSGGTGVIMTAPLAKTLRAHARRPYELELPVGRGPIQRLRRLLGLDHLAWDDMRLDWWIDRIEDLATLPVPKFVAKHGAEPWTRSGTLSEARVWQMRVALLGRRRRPAGWWRTPEVLALLQGHLPQDVVAKRLHITAIRVGELRRKLRRETRTRHSRGAAARRKRPSTHGRTPRG